MQFIAPQTHGNHMKYIEIFAFALSLGLSGCAYNQAQDDADNLTVGKVQSQIEVGMPSAKVAEVLGSPNIVTTDKERNEVWIYDKISTSVQSQRTSGGLMALVIGGGAGGGLGFNGERYGRQSSQKTLTVIVKFDKDHMVRDLAYHTSKF